jgi:hypothetical protein
MTDHTLRRTDELLSELVELVETARTLPMSASCIVPREHTLDLLDDLRDALPPEIVEAREVNARRDELLQLAGDAAIRTRQQATEQADAILADATHRAESLLADAERRAAAITEAAQREHADLVSNTSVHQAAAAAASAVRESAEQYHAARKAEVDGYHAEVRAAVEAYAHRVRAEADEYAATLTGDAQAYADRTLAELSDTLHRAAATADQGRAVLADRRDAAISG